MFAIGQSYSKNVLNMILNIILLIKLFVDSSDEIDNKFIYRVKILRNQTSQDIPPRLKDLDFAVDGNTKTCVKHLDRFVFSHSVGPWWMVELDRIYKITHIKLFYNHKKYTRKEIQKEKNVLFSHAFDIQIGNNASNHHNYEFCAYHREVVLIFPGRYIDIPCKNAISGKFVKVKSIDIRILLCEVQVFADLKSVNLAYKRPFVQLGTLLSDTSALSVDGDPQTCGVMKTVPYEMPWWRVILDKVYYVTDITFSSKTPEKYWYLDTSVRIFVSHNELNYEELLCATSDEIEILKGTLSMTCKKPTPGRFVTLQKYRGEYPNILVLCEVEIFSRRSPPEISNETSHCLEHEYKCLEGECIHRDWLCDGTNDCPLADDEALSCKGDKTKFKCKRFNATIDIKNRCDGVWDCPDYSDEEHCFEMYTKHLTATFKGEPRYYICSDDWNIKYSADICKQYDRDYNATEYTPLKKLKFLKIDKHRTLSDKSDFMSLFNESGNCSSKKIVNVECDYKQEKSYICGKRGIPDALLERYVINGHEAKRGAWPWHVQLFDKTWNEGSFCGGSLLNNEWILTSAHCFENNNDISKIYAKFGSNVYDSYYSYEYYVSHFIRHPEYKKRISPPKDIALLKLKSPVRYTDHIRPICLPDKVMDIKTLMQYQHCVLAGFGCTDLDQSHTDVMLQARMNYLPNKICAKYLTSFTNVDMNFIIDYFKNTKVFCAGQLPLISSAHSCHGDSGSPFVCKAKNGIWTQIGIATASILNKNVKKRSNSLFLQVDHYLDFIHTVMSKEYKSKFGRMFTKQYYVILYLTLGVILTNDW